MLTKALVAPVQQSGAATQWRSPARLAPYAVTLCYAVLVAVGILHHEPWADEAQAWQLSRCLSVPDLLIHHLRYEGHPGLWYVVLWCLNRLHVSYAGMHWFTGLMATCGVGLLIFRAPFPRSVRYVLPFTFYLAFQYAVVARGYALAPLLLFAVAVVWRRSSLLLLAVLLGFLANLELFFIPVSLGFAVLVGFEIHRAQRAARLVWASAIVLAVLCVLSLVTVFPLPKDILYGGLSRDGLRRSY